MMALVMTLVMPMMTLVMSMVSLVWRRWWRCRIVRWRIFWGCSWCLLLLLRQERLEGGGHGLHPLPRLLLWLEEEPGDVVAGPGADSQELGQTSSRRQVRSVRDVGRVLTSSYQVRREDQLGSSQHGAAVSSIVPGQHAVAVQDELHLLPGVAEPSLCNDKILPGLSWEDSWELTGELPSRAGPDRLCGLQDRTVLVTRAEPHLDWCWGWSDYTDTMVTRHLSFLSDCRHHYTALYTVYCDAMIINYSSNNFLDIIEPD